jgi:hypothetical protein
MVTFRAPRTSSQGAKVRAGIPAVHPASRRSPRASPYADGRPKHGRSPRLRSPDRRDDHPRPASPYPPPAEATAHIDRRGGRVDAHRIGDPRRSPRSARVRCAQAALTASSASRAAAEPSIGGALSGPGRRVWIALRLRTGRRIDRRLHVRGRCLSEGQLTPRLAHRRGGLR